MVLTDKKQAGGFFPEQTADRPPRRGRQPPPTRARQRDGGRQQRGHGPIPQPTPAKHARDQTQTHDIQTNGACCCIDESHPQRAVSGTPAKQYLPSFLFLSSLLFARAFLRTFLLHFSARLRSSSPPQAISRRSWCICRRSTCACTATTPRGRTRARRRTQCPQSRPPTGTTTNSTRARAWPH